MTAGRAKKVPSSLLHLSSPEPFHQSGEPLIGVPIPPEHHPENSERKENESEGRHPDPSPVRAPFEVSSQIETEKRHGDSEERIQFQEKENDRHDPGLRRPL